MFGLITFQKLKKFLISNCACCLFNWIAIADYNGAWRRKQINKIKLRKQRQNNNIISLVNSKKDI